MKVLLLCALLAVAYQVAPSEGASQAQMQHDVNYLLFKVYEEVRDPHLKELEDTWDPLGPNAHYDDYDQGTSARKLMQELEDHRLLERQHWFSLFNERQREEALLLYDAMEYAKDWDTFVGNAAYFRKRMNEGQFVYALYAAVTHAEMTEHIVLPPLYEVTPHMFTNSEVIQEAYRAKMTQTPKKIKSKFTGSQKNPEQRVAYFGEDIGMNTHHVIWHLEFPFWWLDERENWHLDRKGESFFWVHHQLTVRFDAERLSNYLDPVDELHWEDVIHEGFAPHTQYKYGGSFPSRPDNVHFEDVDGVARVRDMIIMESRIRDAIAHGYVTAKDGSHINIRDDAHGIDVLGDVIESSIYSPNQEYYGALHNTAHMMLGRQGDPHGKYDQPPGVLEHFETATRDPAFFRLHKYMDNIFREHKDSLPPYTKEEVQFDGVTVDDIHIEGPLETYFEDFEYSLINAVDDTTEVDDVEIATYVPRLAHKDFSFVIDVSNSGAERLGTVRIFGWPRRDNNGIIRPLNEGFWNAIELDKFWVKLSPGANHISRACEESGVTVPDIPSMKELMQKTDAALSSGSDLHLEGYESALGLPNRFLIPKGNEEGLEFVVVVVVTDGDADANVENLHTNTQFNHYGYQGKYPDNRPHGFPLDRHLEDPRIVDELTNFKSTVVKIYNHGEHIHHHD